MVGFQPLPEMFLFVRATLSVVAGYTGKSGVSKGKAARSELSGGYIFIKPVIGSDRYGEARTLI
jgi:hypothetical protein